MLLLIENFDNAQAQRHIDGTLTLSSGTGKGGTNAAVLGSGNRIHFTKSVRAVIGFYTRAYTTGIVGFGYDASTESFRITFTKNTNGLVTISFYNPRQTYIENYPAISNQIAYQDTVTGYSLIEIYLDLTNASAHTGEVKIEIDGIEYCNLSNIVNAPIDLFDDGLNSDEACYSFIYFSGFPLIDSLYVCNENKGYNDDFFGPFDITTLTPYLDGDYTNWERREYSTAVDDSDERGNAGFVSKNPFNPDNAEYENVIASQTLVRDLFYFLASGISGAGEVMALEHRVWHKGLSQDQNTELCVLTPIAKASGRDITDEHGYENLAKPFYFQQMRTPYDVVPTVSTEWTRENLNNTQFGYCFYETEEVDVVLDASMTSTNIVAGTLSNLTDSDDETYLRASNVTFTFSTPIKVKYLQFKVSYAAAISSVKIYEDGKEYSMNAPSTASLITKVSNQSEHLLRDIEQITVTMNSAYSVYNASIFAWEKVGA